MMAQLAEAGKFTLDDVRELEKTIRKLDAQQKAEKRANRNDQSPSMRRRSLVNNNLFPAVPLSTQASIRILMSPLLLRARCKLSSGSKSGAAICITSSKAQDH
jgi:hypothetical protein